MDSDTEAGDEIEEMLEVVEEVDEPIYTDDEELLHDIDITPELYDADAENTPRDADATKTKVKITRTTRLDKGDKVNINVSIKNVTDAVDRSTVALMQFSDELADSILEQAVLISDIYTKDKLNVITRPGGATDKVNVRTIGRPLPGPVKDENGCDRYLLDKLLRSQPDLDDAIVEYEGFNGEEVNFKSDPDVDGAANKHILDVNDKNNNQMDANTISMLSDNYLETIHEDKELVIEHSDVAEDIHRENTPQPEHQEADVDNQPNIDIEEFMFDAATEKSEKDHYSESSEEESEDEIDCCEMTFKEKRILVDAVRKGDVDKVELRLEKRNADMDMVWYGENLLMLAIRADQEKMAEFLIDNDIDLSYEGSLMERSDDGSVTVCTYTAREMAFDRDMEDLVEVIDSKTNNLFPFVKPRQREIRLRRPRPPTPSPTPEEEDEDVFCDPEVDMCMLNESHLNELGSDVCSENGNVKSHKESVETKQSRPTKSRQERRSTMRSSVTSKYEDESEMTMRSASKHSDHNCEIHDDISHVFGQDEGYGTMSPVSPVALAPIHRLERNFIGSKDYVSVRGTRSSHSLKMRNSASRSRSEGAASRSDTYNDNVDKHAIRTLGSYNRESRRWHQVKSAPVRNSMSVESIPDTSVRLGFPFVHGQTGRTNSAPPTKSETPRQRSQSARSNLSPFSHVARLLSESKLLDSNSSSSFKHLPEVRTEALVSRKDARTSYTCIYANTTSSIPGRTIFSYPGTPVRSGYMDTHAKKKVKT